MTHDTADPLPSPPHRRLGGTDPAGAGDRRFHRRVRSTVRLAARRASDESGAATAEYAIATMAAVAFAGLLVAIMQSDEVRQILTDLVRQALTYPG